MAGVWPFLDLSDLVARTRTYLNEVTSVFFTDAEIYRALSVAVKVLNQRLLPNKKIILAQTANATRTVSTNVCKVEFVEYIPTDGSRPISLAKIDPLKVGRYPLNDTTPQYWYEFGNTIAIEPLPNAAYDLRLYVVDTPKLLVSDFPQTLFSYGWAGGVGWTLDTRATNSGGTNPLTYVIANLTANLNYTILFELVAIAVGATLTPKIGVNSGATINYNHGVGYHSQNITAPASAATLTFTPNGSLTIDNVYVFVEADFSAVGDQLDYYLCALLQHQLVLFATELCLKKDQKFDPASMLTNIIFNEMGYMRQHIVETIPDGKNSIVYQ